MLANMTNPSMLIDQNRNSANAGDILKHAVLSWTLHRIVERGFVVNYVETHAGCGQYRIPAGDEARAHLFLGLPRGDTTPTEPYLHALRELMLWDGQDLLYPGSPLIALHALRGERPHGAAFFEVDRSAATTLRALVPERFPVGGSVATETLGNPLRAVGHQQGAVPVVLVDPFGYDRNVPEAALLEGKLNAAALGRLVGWTSELVGKAGPAIVMVWSHQNVDELRNDMRILGADAFRRTVVFSAGIRRGGIATRYRLVVLGAGDVVQLVRGLPEVKAAGGGWHDSPLLQRWDHELFFDPE